MKFASRTRRPMFETLENRVQPGSMLLGLGQLGGLLDLEGLMNNSASRAQELAVKTIQQGVSSSKSDELVIDHQAPEGDLGLNDGQIGITETEGSDAKSYDGGDLSFIDLGAHVLSGILYTGDFNGVNGLANERSTFVSQASIWDSLDVTALKFVGGLWSSNLMSARTFTADYGVRTGVSANTPGTLVFGGTSSAACTSQYFTDAEGFGFIEFSVAVDLNCETGTTEFLVPGEYWVNVTPVGNGGGRSFQSTTSGANAVGSHDTGDSYFDSTFFGYTFEPVETLLGTPTDFSVGLFGS